jgi:hypothetical protein
MQDTQVDDPDEVVDELTVGDFRVAAGMTSLVRWRVHVPNAATFAALVLAMAEVDASLRPANGFDAERIAATGGDLVREGLGMRFGRHGESWAMEFDLPFWHARKRSSDGRPAREGLLTQWERKELATRVLAWGEAMAASGVWVDQNDDDGCHTSLQERVGSFPIAITVYWD